MPHTNDPRIEQAATRIVSEHSEHGATLSKAAVLRAIAETFSDSSSDLQLISLDSLCEEIESRCEHCIMVMTPLIYGGALRFRFGGGSSITLIGMNKVVGDILSDQAKAGFKPIGESSVTPQDDRST